MTDFQFASTFTVKQAVEHVCIWENAVLLV